MNGNTQKRRKATSDAEDMEKPPILLVGMRNGAAAVENCVAAFQLSAELSYDPAILILNMRSQENQKHTSTRNA